MIRPPHLTKEAVMAGFDEGRWASDGRTSEAVYLGSCTNRLNWAKLNGL